MAINQPTLSPYLPLPILLERYIPTPKDTASQVNTPRNKHESNTI